MISFIVVGVAGIWALIWERWPVADGRVILDELIGDGSKQSVKIFIERLVKKRRCDVRSVKITAPLTAKASITVTVADAGGALRMRTLRFILERFLLDHFGIHVMGPVTVQIAGNRELVDRPTSYGIMRVEMKFNAGRLLDPKGCEWLTDFDGFIANSESDPSEWVYTPMPPECKAG